MTELNTKQIKHLRALAHDLKPIIWIGQKGLSDHLFENLDEALRVHELIKVKFHEKEDIDTSLEGLVERTKSTHIQTIGKTVVLYKPNPKKDKEKRIQINHLSD